MGNYRFEVGNEKRFFLFLLHNFKNHEPIISVVPYKESETERHSTALWLNCARGRNCLFFSPSPSQSSLSLLLSPMASLHKHRHSCLGRNPDENFILFFWIPAFAGMTGIPNLQTDRRILPILAISLNLVYHERIVWYCCSLSF